MMPGIDPTIDYAFKRLFGRDQNRPLLIHFLNAVMQPPPEQRVVSLELLNPFNDKEAWDDKLSVVDIKARDQEGRFFDVEMELFADRNFRPRALYYWAKFHQQQLHAGDDYVALRPTVSICLLDNVLYPNEPRYRQRFRLREEISGALFCDHLDVYLLELPKFTTSVESLWEPLDKWLYFFRHATELDTKALPACLQIPEIQTALEDLAMLSTSDVERERYEARVRLERDARSRVAAAREEGLEKGLEKGLRRGLVGRIHLSQRLLRRDQTPESQLLAMTSTELERLALELESELPQ